MQDLEQRYDEAADADVGEQGAEAVNETQEPLELGQYWSPDDMVEDPAPRIDQAQADDSEEVKEQLVAVPDEAGEEQASIIFEQAVESVEDEEAQARLKATIEAAIYITDEPLTPDQIARAVEQPIEIVRQILGALTEEYSRPDRGLSVRELAGGYKMGTKPEHHEAIRLFVKKLQPPFKLSLAALETLAVVAYKQPITAPEIMEIRGVQGTGVLKTLLDRRLIATAGRKDVVGKPIMYKTTKEFLIQFGLSSLGELPTLKEFEELRRLAMTDDDAGEVEGPSNAEEGRSVHAVEAAEAGQGEPPDDISGESSEVESGSQDGQSDREGDVMENTEGHSVELQQETGPATGSKEDEA